MPVPVARIRRGSFALLAVALIAAPAPGRTDPAAVTWEGKIEVASGGGFRGPWRMNDSQFHYVDDPALAINDEGIVGVAWADQSRQDIFFQVFGPDGNKRLEAPAKVSASPRVFSWLPRIVIGPGDAREVYALWQEIVFSGGTHGGEILFARSRDGGKTFDAPLNLSNTIAGDGKGRLTRRYWDNGSLDLAQGPDGDLYAAWTEYEGGLWFSLSTDGGNGFSDPVRVAGGPDKPARGPSLAVGAGGTLYLAWTVGEDEAADIRFAGSADGGRSFGEPRIVHESKGHGDAPMIAVDARGTLHLVYGESPAGPFQRYHIRYTRLEAGERAFEEPREISSPQSDRFESLGYPALGLDGQDNVYVLWELFPRRQHYSQGLGFTVSGDGGRTFQPPSVVPGSFDPARGFNGSQQGSLMRKLAVNGPGAVAVVNSTFRRGQGSGIWLYRGEAAGGPSGSRGGGGGRRP